MFIQLSAPLKYNILNQHIPKSNERFKAVSPIRAVSFQLSWNRRRRGYLTESCSIFVILLPSRIRDLESSQEGSSLQRWNKSLFGPYHLLLQNVLPIYWPLSTVLCVFIDVWFQIYHYSTAVLHPSVWRDPLLQTWQFARQGISPCSNKMQGLRHRWYSQHSSEWYSDSSF